MPRTVDEFKPGQIVAVTQQIPHRSRVWTTRIIGEVVRFKQRKTGSWFARAKDDKLWLDRLLIKKIDGEIVEINLDEFSHVELLDPAKVGVVPPPPIPPPAAGAGKDAGERHAGGDIKGDEARIDLPA